MVASGTCLYKCSFILMIDVSALKRKPLLGYFLHHHVFLYYQVNNRVLVWISLYHPIYYKFLALLNVRVILVLIYQYVLAWFLSPRNNIFLTVSLQYILIPTIRDKLGGSRNQEVWKLDNLLLEDEKNSHLSLHPQTGTLTSLKLFMC